LTVHVDGCAAAPGNDPGQGGSSRFPAHHGPEPYPDGREDVCKTSGTRFDSASGLAQDQSQVCSDSLTLSRGLSDRLHTEATQTRRMIRVWPR
jgi:hypothetical protein